ncbi:MAG: hypothetical protein AMQ22_01667 [Candidatus Methanofastidiosum methylothiophilum]|uniref:Uncharacterized protein n=1 Tax=Candidatus Methanofastidiosum methylothiophilum TaxID=1705564 RepID=A0A150IWT5_9EURY|nr:MAG: hypothetical protein AMQ22_01667 [Candidatus Methanofastidiosum methylthiophilus]
MANLPVYYGWIYYNPETGLCIKKAYGRETRDYDMRPLKEYLQDASPDEVEGITKAWYRRYYCTYNFTRGIFSNAVNHRCWDEIEERTGLKFYLRPVRAEILDDDQIVIQMAREQRKKSFHRDIFWEKYRKLGKPLMRSSRTSKKIKEREDKFNDVHSTTKLITDNVRRRGNTSNEEESR